MGTRSLTVFFDNFKDTEIVVLYRQFDGYPSGHGLELAEFLDDMLIVNGMTCGQPSKIANGMGCLAAQAVAYFKKGPGEFYLHPAGSRELWEEYIYEVHSKTNKTPTIIIKIPQHEEINKEWRLIGYTTLFEGTAKDLIKWVNDTTDK